MSAPAPSLELKGLVPPEPLLPHHTLPVWAWFAIAVGIVAIAYLIIFVTRRLARRGVASPWIDIRAVAYKRATDSLATISGDRIQDAATQASSALRRYLADVSGDPALYETHEEFVSRHQALSAYPDELRAATATTFSSLAWFKYGKDATGDQQEVVSGSRSLLDRLHQFVPANA